MSTVVALDTNGRTLTRGDRVRAHDDRRRAQVTELWVSRVGGNDIAYASIEFDGGGHATYHANVLTNLFWEGK